MQVYIAAINRERVSHWARSNKRVSGVQIKSDTDCVSLICDPIESGYDGLSGRL